jgi:flagellar protein FlgJ
MIQAAPTSTTLGTTAAAPASKTDADKAKLKSAAQAFEAVFLRQMIGSMRSASLGDGMFDNEATDQFQQMADSKTADSMSQHGVLGIAEMLEKQLGARIGATPASAATGAAQASANTSLSTMATTAAAGAHQ